MQGSPRGAAAGGHAGIGRRSVAFLLDLILLYLLLPSFLQGLAEADPFFAVVGAASLPCLYFLLLEWLAAGTVGKLLLGARVRTTGGGRASLWRVLVRNLLRPVDLLLVGEVLILLTPRRQRLGDLLAGTVVVRRGVAAPVAQPASPVVAQAQGSPGVYGLEGFLAQAGPGLEAGAGSSAAVPSSPPGPTGVSIRSLPAGSVASPSAPPAPRQRGPRWRLVVAAGLVGLGAGVWAVAQLDLCSATVTLGERGGVLELEGLRVEFGPEALPAGSQVRGRRLVQVEERYPRDALLQLAGPVYLVEPPPGLSLGATVQVVVPYDPAKLPRPEDTSRLSGAVWDGGGWERRPSVVDPAQRTVAFVAEHFSVIGPVVERDGNYAAISTPRFHIRWNAGPGTGAWLPLAGAQYVSPSGTPDGAVPAYINDLAEFLDDAYDRIQAMGYTMPPTDPKIAVIVQDLNPYGVGDLLDEYVVGGAKSYGLYGQTGVSGPIYFDTRMRQPDGALLAPQAVYKRLKATAGHELFHVVQRYHPSFPTWFYEAGAVFMEWRLYGEEFPEDLPATVSAHPQFLYEGMWGGNVGAAYAKGSFLVYLQEKHGGSCSGPDRDVLRNGVFASGLGGFSSLHIAANVRSPYMDQALLKAAQTCGGYTGTWDDLLGEFARDYYIEWDEWATAETLLRGNRNLPLISAARGNDPAAPQFSWLTTTDRGGSKAFDLHSWNESSAAMWRFEGADDLHASLVLQVAPAGFDWQKLPLFWVYPFHTYRDRAPGVGPKQFVESNPTVAVRGFGKAKQQGAKVEKVYLAGVMGRTVYSALQGGSGSSSLTAYLLPAPHGVATELVEATESGRKVQRLRVTWATNQVWFPSGIKGLSHIVGAYSGDADEPLRSSFGRVPVEKGNSLEIEPPAPGTRLAVVLADRFGNQGPPGLAGGPAAAAPRRSVEEVMKAALARLGYSWETGEPREETGGYLFCAEEGGGRACSYVGVLALGDPHEARVGEWFSITAATTATPAEAEEYFRGKLAGGFSAELYRGINAGTETYDVDDPDLGWVTNREIIVFAGNVVVEGEHRAACGSVDLNKLCPGKKPLSQPTREVDALLEEAVAGGLIPPGTLK